MELSAPDDYYAFVLRSSGGGVRIAVGIENERLVLCIYEDYLAFRAWAEAPRRVCRGTWPVGTGFTILYVWKFSALLESLGLRPKAREGVGDSTRKVRIRSRVERRVQFLFRHELQIVAINGVLISSGSTILTVHPVGSASRARGLTGAKWRHRGRITSVRITAYLPFGGESYLPVL